MEYGEKVMEIMRTRKGKLFAVLLVLTVIFTFTGIAYGTSESMKSEEDLLVQSEEEQVTAVDGNLPATGGSDESQDSKTPEENGADAVIEDPDTDDPDADENIAPVPMVVTDGIVTFTVEGKDQAAIQYGGSDVTKAIEVDPADITKDAPFSFTVTPAEGYEIDTVSAVSTFNDRAKPFVPSTPIGGTEGETNDIPEGSVVYDELSDVMKAALADEGEKKLDALESEVSTDQASAAFTYTIDDMAFFAGRDVTITVKMKEVEYDAWYKVVNALAAGHNVKLSQDLVAGEEITDEAVSDADKMLNKQPAVVKAGSDVTLDLNGHSIESKLNGVDALFLANGAGTKFTITDPNSAPIYGGNGTVSVSADQAGQLASWDAASRTLTYYVTDTIASNDSTSELRLTGTVKVPDNAGMISGGSANLIKGGDNATINIEGGVFSVNSKAVNIANSTLNMTGGYIVGCNITSDNGAAINAANSAVSIAGNAIIAGNTATATNPGPYAGGNGGAIAIFSTEGGTATTDISGNAIIAGNKASCGSTLSAFERPTNGLGGGIYTKTTKGSVALNVGGNAVISGNVASYDGGGIYHMQGTLNLNGSAYITNNATETGQTETGHTGTNYAVHYGGGGVFSTDLVKVGGNVKVTSNKAAGSGGGLLMPAKDKQVTAVLKMDSGYFAANAAITNEGGGMCLTTKGADGKNGSYIYSGYISNNGTATEYDYGGGGIFVTSSGGELYVYNPLVTKNKAEGSGGGVAACQNGIVISSDAAIFDNTAGGASVPSGHPIGGQWPSEMGFTTSANTVDGKYAASDFYGAKESTIYNDMLSTGDDVGSYNWKGFMSGSNATKCASASLSNNSSSNNWFTLKNAQGDTIGSVYSPAYFSTAWVNSAKTRIAIYLPKKELENAGLTPEDIHGMLDGVNFEYYKNSSTPEKYRLTIDGLDAKWLEEGFQGSVEYYSFQCSLSNDYASLNYKYGGALYNADGSVNTSGWEKFTDKTITGTTFNGNFEIFKINDFPKNEEIDGEMKSGYADAKRMMGLTAFPSDQDKANAIAAARLVVCGNYSAANGGGIAVNGKITIGRDPKSNVPDEPDTPDTPKYASLTINKAFDNAIEQGKAGKATVLFKVNGYINEMYYHAAKDKPFYSDVLEINFDVDEKGVITTNGIQLDNLPVGAFFVIEEITDSGFNTSNVGGSVKTVTIVAGEDGQVNIVGFTNTYNPDKPWNDSIQNDWTKSGAKLNEQGGGSEGSDTPGEE